MSGRFLCPRPRRLCFALAGALSVLLAGRQGRAEGEGAKPSDERSGRSDVPPPLNPESDTAPLPPKEGGEGFRLALQTEGAFGLSNPSFYNHLLGARIDYVLPSGFALGGYLGYINLKGKEGRAPNVIGYGMLEYAPRWSSTSEVRLPFRFATGYLPKNGPVLRFSAGLSFPVGKTTRLGFDVLAPTWWIVRNRTLVSLDIGVELTFAL